jgi:hypothetical protein
MSYVAVGHILGTGGTWMRCMAESFASTLKKAELVDRHRFPTRAAARVAIFEYIEGFYNLQQAALIVGLREPFGLREG